MTTPSDRSTDDGVLQLGPDRVEIGARGAHLRPRDLERRRRRVEVGAGPHPRLDDPPLADLLPDRVGEARRRFEQGRFRPAYRRFEVRAVQHGNQVAGRHGIALVDVQRRDPADDLRTTAARTRA